MIVGECITSLLFPFVWPHVYAPILPASLHHFLDAPVPFVMGLHADATDGNGSGAGGVGRLGSEATLCYVDIDRKTIQLPEELPQFPHRGDLMAELAAALDRFNVQHSNGVHDNDARPGSGGLVAGVGIGIGGHGIAGGGQNHILSANQRSYLHRPDFDAMSASCTLPSGMQASRRKHSLNNMLDWDRCPPHNNAASDATNSSINGGGAGGGTPSSSPRFGGGVEGGGSAVADVMPPPAHSRIAPLSVHEQYCDDLRLNNTVREIVLNRFVQMFADYEHFVIWPNQEREQWLSNRESLQNFDKASFLSDQQQHHRPFLSRFLESQMFATLVDNKIMSVWDGDVDANLRLFDNRIKILR